MSHHSDIDVEMDAVMCCDQLDLEGKLVCEQGVADYWQHHQHVTEAVCVCVIRLTMQYAHSVTCTACVLA